MKNYGTSPALFHLLGTLCYIWERNPLDEKLKKFRNIRKTIHRYLKNKTKKETWIRIF